MKDEKQQKVKKTSPKRNDSKPIVKRTVKTAVKVKPKTSPKTKTKPTGKSLPKSQKTVAENMHSKSVPTPPVRSSQNSAIQQNSQAKPTATNRKKTLSVSSKKRLVKLRSSEIAKFAFLVFVLLLFVFIAAIKFGGITFSNVTDGVKGLFSAFSPGDGFPYKITETNINDIDMMGSNILILGEDSAKVINASAKETFSNQNIFSNPAIDTCNGRTIMFDKASGRFKVLSRSGVLFEKNIGQNIFTAAIGKKGNVAVASESKKAQSELAVYNTNKNQVFAWECALERISAVSLSDNGKSIAVAVIGAKNGELYSRLLVFDFDKSEATVSLNYPETSLIKVKFINKDTVIAVGDNLFSTITLETQKKQDVSFGSSTLHRLFIYENGKTALILAPFGNKAQSELKVYGLNGELLFEKSLGTEVVWVAGDNNYTSVLLEDAVKCFNKDGELMGSIKLENEAERIIVKGKKTYVVSEGEINQYSTVGVKQ